MQQRTQRCETGPANPVLVADPISISRSSGTRRPASGWGSSAPQALGQRRNGCRIRDLRVVRRAEQWEPDPRPRWVCCWALRQRGEVSFLPTLRANFPFCTLVHRALSALALALGENCSRCGVLFGSETSTVSATLRRADSPTCTTKRNAVVSVGCAAAKSVDIAPADRVLNWPGSVGSSSVSSHCWAR